jgi:2-amino-4-hydroxy-6-hydroxymethyldihydropteridine diphosphokinase
MSIYRLILAFGSNSGNREINFKNALVELEHYAVILSNSSWKETAPLKSSIYDTSTHEYYINFVAEILTYIDPISFYKNVIVKIENKIGHSRERKWMPRALDIDIVFAAKNDNILFKDCTPIELIEGDFYIPHLEYNNRVFWKMMIEEEMKYVSKRQ